MKKINSIVVFDNDQYLLALLNGYCFANHIALTYFDFNINSINKLEKLKPVLVFIPINLISLEHFSLEITLLRRLTGVNSQVKVCGLNKASIETISNNIHPWLDLIINTPYDIGMIDGCLNITSNLVERRSYEERRTEDRRLSRANKTSNRSQKANDSYRKSDDATELIGLHINQASKCLFLNGVKVDLTPKEFELVELLTTDVEHIFTADEIIRHLWPESCRATKADLYQYMHLLRKKIEQDPNNPQWIINVKGFGYTINTDGLQENFTRKQSI
jgi:DNA-binding winged helix-turn-helix (wHTH) protein